MNGNPFSLDITRNKLTDADCFGNMVAHRGTLCRGSGR